MQGNDRGFENDFSSETKENPTMKEKERKENQHSIYLFCSGLVMKDTAETRDAHERYAVHKD